MTGTALVNAIIHTSANPAWFFAGRKAAGQAFENFKIIDGERTHRYDEISEIVFQLKPFKILAGILVVPWNGLTTAVLRKGGVIIQHSRKNRTAVNICANPAFHAVFVARRPYQILAEGAIDFQRR